MLQNVVVIIFTAQAQGQVFSSMTVSLTSQARELTSKALLRFPGCESRDIRGLTRPVGALVLRRS
jgi:hypothetical protein